MYSSNINMIQKEVIVLIHIYLNKTCRLLQQTGLKEMQHQYGFSRITALHLG